MIWVEVTLGTPDEPVHVATIPAGSTAVVLVGNIPVRITTSIAADDASDHTTTERALTVREQAHFQIRLAAYRAARRLVVAQDILCEADVPHHRDAVKELGKAWVQARDASLRIQSARHRKRI